MKVIFFILSFILLNNFSLYSSDYSVEQSAQTWFKTYVLSSEGAPLLNPSELQILINVVYFSYLRSQSTLNAQTKALDALETVWQTAQNITHLRLNPSIDLPYQKTATQNKKIANALWTAQQEHHRIGTTYAQAFELILKKDLVSSTALTLAITKMRTNARQLIMQALLDVKQHVGDLCIYLTQPSPHTQKNRSLLDTVSSYVPFFTTSSFAKINKAHLQASSKAFQALILLQQSGNHVWRIIEQTRGAWYFELYKQLYQLLITKNAGYLGIVFDETGYIPVTEKIVLPKPELLPGWN